MLRQFVRQGIKLTIGEADGRARLAFAPSNRFARRFGNNGQQIGGLADLFLKKVVNTAILAVRGCRLIPIDQNLAALGGGQQR